MSKAYSLSAGTKDEVLANIKEFVTGDKEQFITGCAVTPKTSKVKTKHNVLKKQEIDYSILEHQSKEGHL